MNVVASVTLDMKNIKAVEADIQKALLKTADAIKTDVQKSQTMPKDTGNLQDDSTFIDDSELKNYEVSIINDTPYARRLYFHPEYNFSKRENPDAAALWYEPYISGEKKDYAQKVFAHFMKNP